MAFTDSPETKLVPNLPFADYCHAPGVNQSRLKLFDYELGGCPALYLHATLHPDEQKDTRALTDGRRYHHFVLEPDSFDRFYTVRTKAIEDEIFEKAKEDKTCKAKGFSTKLKVYEAWKAQTNAMGLEILTQSESDVLHEMRRALMLNSEVFDELGACRSDQLEVSGFAGFEFKRGPHEGKRLQLKARFDLVPEGDALIDLKTARTASPRLFARQAYDLGYAIQAAFYQDVANANGLNKKRFGFLVQDKTPPYLSCIHWVDGWLGYGRLRYTVILSHLADAIKADRWPGYPSGQLEPPGFALEEIEAAA
ncbi:MAG: hypothetical protein QOE26_2731 [Verrucomicrobiota bacterium]|jgi:hypothetical protein